MDVLDFRDFFCGIVLVSCCVLLIAVFALVVSLMVDVLVSLFIFVYFVGGI